MTLVFWIAVAGVLYPYLLYPVLLWGLGRLRPRRRVTGLVPLPTVTVIIPLSNEEGRVDQKVANTAALRYPPDRLQILFVSDGSTDRTVERLRLAARGHESMGVIERPVREGKAAALNAGLAEATGEIVVFSDASILLEPDALHHIVQPFADPAIGCVSGEDKIPESGGEAWYGRYELLLRRLESDVHSIVGASGSFYAQRRALCQDFTPGMAPDFLSVLRTVAQGARAVSEPRAVGTMNSVKNPRHEFERKVRTLIRGLTTLFAYLYLLNPLRYGLFAFALFSHKVLRWTAPVFLVAAFASSLALAAASPWYAAFFAAQALFYAAALGAHAGVGALERTLPGKVALYFSTVNAAVLAAWLGYVRGVRLEVWTPSRR